MKNVGGSGAFACAYSRLTPRAIAFLLRQTLRVGNACALRLRNETTQHLQDVGVLVGLSPDGDATQVLRAAQPTNFAHHPPFTIHPLPQISELLAKGEVFKMVARNLHHPAAKMTITMPLVSTQPLPGKYWEWRGEQIYYVQAGVAKVDRPALLLIHGFGASTDHWRKNISELSQEFQVWAIDLLGFGRAAKPAWTYSAQLWREQLHDFITEVIDQPVVLAGNSLGGYAALCVAAEYPEATAGLVLINSAGPFTDSTHPKEPNLIQKVLNKGVTGFLRNPVGNSLLYKFVQRKTFIRNTLKKVYVDQAAVTDQLVNEIYRPSCDAGAPQVFASVFSNQQGEKVDVMLNQMQCPLLMIWGEGDPWIDARKRGAKFREYCPQLQEHYLNAGHCPHDEVPLQVNAIIHNWIKEHRL